MIPAVETKSSFLLSFQGILLVELRVPFDSGCGEEVTLRVLRYVRLESFYAVPRIICVRCPSSHTIAMPTSHDSRDAVISSHQKAESNAGRHVMKRIVSIFSRFITSTSCNTLK